MECFVHALGGPSFVGIVLFRDFGVEDNAPDDDDADECPLHSPYAQELVFVAMHVVQFS